MLFFDDSSFVKSMANIKIKAATQQILYSYREAQLECKYNKCLLFFFSIMLWSYEIGNTNGTLQWHIAEGFTAIHSLI